MGFESRLSAMAGQYRILLEMFGSISTAFTHIFDIVSTIRFLPLYLSLDAHFRSTIMISNTKCVEGLHFSGLLLTAHLWLLKMIDHLLLCLVHRRPRHFFLQRVPKSFSVSLLLTQAPCNIFTIVPPSTMQVLQAWQ